MISIEGMDDALAFSGLTEVAEKLRTKALSPVELTRAMLDRIASLDGKLHSFERVMPDSALAEAQLAEAEIAAGTSRGPLHGVPLAVKDLCWTADAPTAAGMAMHRGFQPVEDSTVVAKLRAAGCRDPRQARHDGRRLCGLPPRHDGADLSLGPGGLARDVVERFRGRDRGRVLLRLDRFGHRRPHPLPLGRQRAHRHQADLGPRQPTRCLRTRRNARQSRADVPQRRRCGRNAGRHRWGGSEGPDHAAGSRAGLSRGHRRQHREAEDRHRAGLYGARHGCRCGDGFRGGTGGPRRSRRHDRRDRVPRCRANPAGLVSALRRRGGVVPCGHVPVAAKRVRAHSGGLPRPRAGRDRDRHAPHRRAPPRVPRPGRSRHGRDRPPATARAGHERPHNGGHSDGRRSRPG